MKSRLFPAILILMMISMTALSAAEFDITGSRAVFNSRNRIERRSSIDITDGNVLMSGKERVVLSGGFLTITVNPESVVILKDTVPGGFVVYLVDGGVEVYAPEPVGVTLYTTVTQAEGILDGAVSLISTEDEEKISSFSIGELDLYDSIRGEHIPLETGGTYDYFTKAGTIPLESGDCKTGDSSADRVILGREFEDFGSLSERLLFVFGKDCEDRFVRLG